jgi:hypothetical protein
MGDVIWDYWSKTKYTPMIENPTPNLYGGSNTEPLASIGMAHFIDPIKYKFKDGLTIIDYGCGAGILANFISARLKDFIYYGLEPDSDHGTERINLAMDSFQDNRVEFGFIDEYDYLIDENKIDAVVLISIFTHFKIDKICEILDNVIKVFDKSPDATVIFSCFPAEVARVDYDQPNINEGFYGASYIKLEELENYCHSKNLILEKYIDFIAMGGFKHEIFTLRKSL